MRLGLFGGTFDPPHFAHVAVARAARDALRLDLLEVIPSGQPPHRNAPEACAADRYAMVTLAFLDEERLVPSPRELRREGASYTVDTLREVRAEYPGADLFLILGADSYDDLPNWREASTICQLAHLAVVPRPGSDGVLAPRPDDRARVKPPDDEFGVDAPRALIPIPMAELDVAARDIRHDLHENESARPALPASVRRYIRVRRLYTMDVDTGNQR
jgi:nicotinate-nucleotide adenylyltransferase